MSAIDLTSVSLVREWMPAPATTAAAQLATQSSVLQAAITAASLDFLRRIGRGPQNNAIPSQSPFVDAVQFNETYDGNGNDRQFVRNFPIISVQSLQVSGVSLDSSSYQIDGSGKSIVLVSSTSFPYPAFGRCVPRQVGFPRGRQNVAIAYTAGFAARTVTSELQTVPASPGPYTVATTYPWLADGGVKYFSTGNPLTAVQVAPQQGQYYLDGSTYLFNSADAGQQLQISYTAAGTPADIELAVRRMVFLTYQRRGWEGLRSLAKPDSGQTTYSSWEVDPSVQEVISNYSRAAIV